MLGLVSQVEADLRTISLDSRRKFPEVKEAAERALLRLRATVEALPKDATPAQQAAAVAEAEDVLLPFRMALATRSDTLPLSALTGVQRMISHNALAPARIPDVVQLIVKVAQLPTTDEASLLRVLQTVLTIASSPALLRVDSTASQRDMLLLCLTLQQSRSPTIKNTASATVQQFVAVLLDAVAQEPESPHVDDEDMSVTPALLRPDLASLSVTARCAFLSVQDLCILANGEPAQWLSGSGLVSVPFALEVIQRTLRSHTFLFLSKPPFQFLLKERVCPLVLRTMQQPQQEWAVALRLCHLTCTLLTGYSSMLHTETEILLSMLAKALLSESAPIWQRALSLETFRVLLQDAQLVRSIFTAYDSVDSSSNVFAGLVMAVCSTLRSPAIRFSEHAEYIEDVFMKHYRSSLQGKPPAFNLALYSDTDGSQISNDYAAALAIECQVYLTRTIHSLAAPFTPRSKDDDAQRQPDLPVAGDAETARQMVGATWQPLLGALSLLLARCSSEEAVQVLLKCYQSYTQACGILSLQQPRDEFLSSLCYYALPPRARQDIQQSAAGMSFAPVDAVYEPLPNTSLSAKNVQALKAVFNIAHCMGALLDTAWNLILQTFEQLDRIIASSKTTASSARAAELATATGGPDATSNELRILSTALDNLFSGSSRLDDDAIAHFLTALSTQCFASLAHEATSREKLAVPGSASAQPPRLFALTKFMETVLTNLHRIETLWPLVTQFLLPVANHKAQRIRLIGMDSLAKVVIAAMRKRQKGESNEVRDGDWVARDEDGWDRTVLAPLEELQRRCAYRETQERILQATHQVLQACGKGLLLGWQLLLSVLWRAATKPSLVPLLPLAFRSVQLIASDFLSVLPPACLLAYVEVAAVYATQRHHLNIALTAIGLQWTITDYLSEYGAAGGRAAEAGGMEAVEAEEDEAAAAIKEDNELEGVPATSDALDSDAAAEEAGGSANASAPRYGDLDVSKHEPLQKQWRAIVRQLRRLCADGRPEVRTAAMHSLTSVLTSHGGALSGVSWDYILLRLLLPLMHEVVERAGAADASETVAPTLGTEGGRPVLMLLHHSRDTASKQWDDTWVLALSSFLRLFRTFLPLLEERPSFERAWSQLLSFCEKSLLSLPRSSEVAFAAVGSVLDLMLSSVAPRRPVAPTTTSPSPPQPLRSESSLSGAVPERIRLPAPMWDSVWEMIKRVVETASASPEAQSTHKEMLSKLVFRMGELYKSSPDCFVKADVLRLLQLVEKLRVELDSWNPLIPAQPCTPLQDSRLALLEALSSFPPSVSGSEMQQLFLQLLLKLIRIPTEVASQLAAGTYIPPQLPAVKKKNVQSFSDQAHALMVRVLTSRAEPRAQAAVFIDTMHVLRPILAYRLQPQCLAPELPQEAAAAFVVIIEATLPAVSQHSTTLDLVCDELIETTWMVLHPPTSAVNGILRSNATDRGDVGPLPSLPAQATEAQQKLEVAVLHAIPNMLRCCKMTTAQMRRVLQVYEAVLTLSADAAIERDAVWKAGARTLCNLSSDQPLQGKLIVSLPTVDAAQGMETCKLAANLLVDCMAFVMEGWSHASGSLGTLLAPRAAQLLNALNIVANLTIPCDTLQSAPGSSVNSPPCTGRRGHLVRLAPLLVQCIGQPPPADSSVAMPHECAELQLAIRATLLHFINELGL